MANSNHLSKQQSMIDYQTFELKAEAFNTIGQQILGHDFIPEEIKIELWDGIFEHWPGISSKTRIRKGKGEYRVPYIDPQKLAPDYGPIPKWTHYRSVVVKREKLRYVEMLESETIYTGYRRKWIREYNRLCPPGLRIGTTLEKLRIYRLDIGYDKDIDVMVIWGVTVTDAELLDGFPIRSSVLYKA